MLQIAQGWADHAELRHLEGQRGAAPLELLTGAWVMQIDQFADHNSGELIAECRQPLWR